MNYPWPAIKAFTETFKQRPYENIIVSAEEYRVSMDEQNNVICLEQRGKLNVTHIWGTGERFHTVDLKKSDSSGAVTEKFTRQGEQTYLPMPFSVMNKVSVISGIQTFRYR